jgi:hypothetical protein
MMKYYVIYSIVFLHSMLWLLVSANVVLSLLILVTLVMEVICSSKMSDLTRAIQHNIPKVGSLHSHCHENLKSYTSICMLSILYA